MKINIKRHTKIQQLRKTHNLYLYSQGNKVYYVAKPKRNVRVKRERVNLFWPALAILALVLSVIAINKNDHPVVYAENEEVIEYVEEPETTESVREMQGEAEEKPEENTSSSYSGVCKEYYDIVSKYDWDVNLVLAIMKAESGCNPNAVNYNTNGTKDTGLMQLNSAYWKQTMDPEENIAEAYRIYTRWGNTFNAWCAYTNGSYLKYLSK